MKNLNLEKITERGEKIHYYQEVTVNFIELYCGYNLIDPIPFLVQGDGLFVLYCWLGGKWNAGEIGVTVMIFMCRVVVTVVIVGA